MVFLLRVPPTSLKNLKDYAQLLERHGWEPAGCVTRLSFDYNEAYPKLMFNFVDGLDDNEYAHGRGRSPSRQHDVDMLSAPDFDSGGNASRQCRSREDRAARAQAAPILAEPA